MEKYIKESDLFKRILNVDFKHDYDGCIKFCQSIPDADVEEVRHGRWIIEDKYTDYRTERCSACGFAANRAYVQDIWRYCPNCGARMETITDD